MVNAMFNKDGTETPPKRVSRDSSICISEITTLAHFTTKNSKKIFCKLSLPQEFLDLPVSEWSENIQFIQAKEVVDSLPVVNDHAERGVHLIEEYSGRHTKSEEELHDLLQVVSEHRKKYPKASKTTLLGDNE